MILHGVEGFHTFSRPCSLSVPEVSFICSFPPLSVPRVLLAHLCLFLGLSATPQPVPEALCYHVIMFANRFFSAIWKIGVFFAECLNKTLSSFCCPISDISSEILPWSILGLILQSLFH